MEVLFNVIKYENIFEDYIKFSKDNKHKTSAFLNKKCSEVQELLDNYNPEEQANNPIT